MSDSDKTFDDKHARIDDNMDISVFSTQEYLPQADGGVCDEGHGPPAGTGGGV